MTKTSPRVGRMVAAGAFALAATVVGARTARCAHLAGAAGPLEDALIAPIHAPGIPAIASAAPGTILVAEEGTDTGDDSGGSGGTDEGGSDESDDGDSD
jgi:hypothetical protein